MPKDNIIQFQVGELTGALKAVTKATEDNTKVLETVTAYMHKTMGANEERDKHYRRIRHTAVGSAIIAVGTLIRTVFHG